MLNKSYKGFVIWLIAFSVGIPCLAFLPIEDGHFLTRVLDVACAAGLEVLMLMMYKTEKIFWINGVSYEEALEAGSDRRRAFALKFVKRFGILTLGILLFSLLAQLLRLNVWIDILVMVAGIIACAFSTTKLKP